MEVQTFPQLNIKILNQFLLINIEEISKLFL